MKAYERILILFSLLCLCACKDKPYPKILLVADSLTYVNPQSAIAILEEQKGNMETESEETQMYYHLLCIKAKDKAYVSHDTDSQIFPILHYYMEKKNSPHLPEVYYYTGRVYRDLGDAPQALEYFRKASELPNVDADLKSKIYSQIRTLFLYQDIYDEALKVSQESYMFDSLRNDQRGMVFDLRDIADAYRGSEKLDSAFIYFQRACDLAYTLQDSSLVKMAQSQMASICVQLGMYKQAKKALTVSLNANNRITQSAVFSIASELYRKIGCTDSAIYYYKKLLDSDIIYAKRKANWRLAEAELEKDNSYAAKLYLKQYMIYDDSINKITNAETIRKMNSLYNYQLREKENIRLKAENEKKAKVIIVFGTLVIILVAGGSAYWQYDKRKRLMFILRSERIERLKDNLIQKYAQQIEESKNRTAELTQRLEYADNEIEDLKKQLSDERELIRCAQTQVAIETKKRNEKDAQLKNTEIYKYIVNQITSNTYKMNQSKWNDLENTINEIYDCFTKKLNLIYKMNDNELRVSLLIKAGIQPAEVAQLVNQTRQSVSQVRRRLYEKFHNKKGEPKFWDEFICSL